MSCDPNHRTPSQPDAMIRQRRSRWGYGQSFTRNSNRKVGDRREQAGFSVEQMIGFLNDGLTVETFLDLISWRLGQSHQGPATSGSPSTWIHEASHSPDWGSPYLIGFGRFSATNRRYPETSALNM